VRYYSAEPGNGINVTGNTGSGFAQTPFGSDAATSAKGEYIRLQRLFLVLIGIFLLVLTQLSPKSNSPYTSDLGDNLCQFM
jgi:hypothetical protein